DIGETDSFTAAVVEIATISSGDESVSGAGRDDRSAAGVVGVDTLAEEDRVTGSVGDHRELAGLIEHETAGGRLVECPLNDDFVTLVAGPGAMAAVHGNVVAHRGPAERGVVVTGH